MKRIVLFLTVLLLVPSAAFGQTIERAYQKEFAYLQAQKEALGARLTDLEKNGQRSRGSETREITALRDRLVGMQLDGDGLQEQLGKLERDAGVGAEHTESLRAVFEQANASLERYDRKVEIAGETPTAAELKTLFETAMPVLDDASQVKSGPEAFFLRDGSRVEGTVTRIGRVAAFGESARGAGPLAPAGEGRLKLWGASNGSGVYLFENLDKAVEEKEAKTWLDTVEAGGIIAWVIVVMGLIGLFLAGWRTIVLAIAGRGRGTIAEVRDLVATGRADEALGKVGAMRGPTARVLKCTLGVMNRPAAAADDAIAEAILMEQPRLDRFGTAIMVFAAVAPLLGLLGTVTGMIATFDVITEFGTGDPRMLSGGISEALITTQLGLVVAIPALLVGNLLNARAAGLVDGFEQAALAVLNAARGGRPEPDPVRVPTAPKNEPVLVELAG